MNEDWAEVVAIVENAGGFQKAFEGAFAVAKSLNVGDLLVGLESEAKTWVKQPELPQ